MLKFRYLAVAVAFVAALAVVSPSYACTSMVVGAKASATGRPMLWKHRDTGTQHNFVQRTPATDGHHAFVGLYNGGDSLLTEAWMGFNDAGFAIMNTASYNLAPDTAKYKDREGAVMRRALQICSSVGDFQALLDTLARPMGIQANFGVLDNMGNGGYFEANDSCYVFYDVNDSDNGYIVRTNFSVSGNDTDGMGYIRYDNARHLLCGKADAGKLTPEDFTEGASRSFYHSLLDRDFLADTSFHYAVDQDFIPRRSAAASVVVELPLPGDAPELTVMWTALGYPAVSHVLPAFIDDVPEALQPLQAGFRAEACNEAIELKSKAFPITRGSGKHYVDLDFLRCEIPRQRQLSAGAYSSGRRDLALRAKNLKGKHNGRRR